MDEVYLDYKDIFICPNCREGLSYFREKGLSCFYCERCEIVFPVIDNIPVILADEIRNYELEHQPLTQILEEIQVKPLQEYIENTLSLVESKKGKTTWEWDDEKFWGKQYRDQLSRREDLDRNDRLWQRAPMVEKLLEGSTLEGKVILSLGSGDGNNFRTLFLNHCDEDTLYIAQDISFNGLALNRQLNPHKKSIYLLCSCDYELPIVSSFVDLIVYFGILHHTRMKDENISKDKILLKERGYVMLHEALDRPKFFFSKMFEGEKSEHEEYVSKKKILRQLSIQNGFRIILKREDSTPFFTFFMLFFRKTMINNKRVFDAILYVDEFVAKTLGRLFSYFDAGCVAILAQKKIKIN